MARNEAGKFLRSALEAWLDFSDEVVLLDDNSDDHTFDVACKFPQVRKYRNFEGESWGKESHTRQVLWMLACDYADVGDYILIADADQTPARDPRPLLASEPDAVAFTLYDLWSPNEYRTDGYWKGHTAHRVWLVRRGEEPAEGWKWSDRGIHVGHLPLNLPLNRILYAPADFGLLHYAYSSPALRVAKDSQYRSVAAQLSAGERAHAESILAPATLSPLPFTPQYTLRLANEA